MHIDIKIGPYEITQRTEYSKIKILSIKENKDLSDTKDGINIAKKIISDYIKQKNHPEDYFEIYDNCLIQLKKEMEDEDINSIFIPEGIIEMQGEACRTFKMEFLKLPNTLKKIGDYAFYHCHKLNYVDVPDSVLNINECAFESCVSLKYIKLSNNMKAIQSGTFLNCLSLEKIDLPNSVEEIGESAFESCLNLKKIILPQSLKSIDTSAFYKCGLEEISIPDSVENIEKYVFAHCKNLNKVKLSEKLKILPDAIFSNCNNLEYITLPDSICEIHDEVFKKCTKVKEINIPEKLNIRNASSFRDSDVKTLIFNYDLKDLVIPGCSKEYGLIFNSNIDKLIIKNTVKYLNPIAFKHVSSQIKTIDYLGTKEEFKEFKKNNKELFNYLTDLKNVSFAKSEKEKIDIQTKER